MPIHDWTRVYDGAFHDQHNTWVALLKVALNAGLLPEGYYAQVGWPVGSGEVTPKSVTAFALQPEAAAFATFQRRVEIRHTDGHRVVALIEIVSRGNKSAAYPFDQFVTKVAAALYRGVHVLVIDLHPPTARDPRGIHSAIWAAIGEEGFQPPPGRPLTLASYDAGAMKVAFVEPVAVGDVLRPMPLFLEPGAHIPVPLEETYMQAYASVPRFYREILEAPAGG